MEGIEEGVGGKIVDFALGCPCRSWESLNMLASSVPSAAEEPPFDFLLFMAIQLAKQNIPQANNCFNPSLTQPQLRGVSKVQASHIDHPINSFSNCWFDLEIAC